MIWRRPRADDFHIGRAAADAFYTFRSDGAAQRRAAVLCQLGDALSLTRPRGWAARSRRAYEGAIRRLDRRARYAGAPEASDPGAVARALLREARRPYGRFALVLVRVAVAAFAGLALLAALVSVASPAARAWLFSPDLGATATWTASSSHVGAASAGNGTRPNEKSASPAFFMHTDLQDRPWLKITLPRPAKVREVRIWNRPDCCQERTIPLNVQVPDGDGWRLICQRRSPFSKWACHPKPAVTTNVIRIEIPQTSMLHLKRVAIYE